MLLFGGFSKLRNEGSIPVPNAFAIFGPLLSVALKIITVGWAPHGVAQWFRRSQGDVWFRVTFLGLKFARIVAIFTISGQGPTPTPHHTERSRRSRAEAGRRWFT